MASVRPFQFKGLPKLTRSQVALQASLTGYVASEGKNLGITSGLAQIADRYLKSPCKIATPELKTIRSDEIASLVPALGCFVVVGAAPGEHKILVDLDLTIASFAVERLLGGQGQAERVQRPLTDIEEGVLSFLLLKVLGHFSEQLSNGRSLALTLDRFAGKLTDLQKLLETETDYVMLGARVTLGKLVGYARVLIPAPLVDKGFHRAVPQAGGSPDDYAYMRKLLGSLGERRVVGRVEAATLDLSPDDIAGLEAGDIVILENHQLTKTDAGVSGLVFIKIGSGRNGGLRAQLLEGEPARAQVTEIVVQEEPQEDEAMADPQGEGAEVDNLPETEGLLRDVPGTVVVELGRLRMNTAQVVRLRAGQILRLPRGPNDHVDLVVNGKVFARGELIEVDGELGVRLVQVIGATG
jgi:type III secretion system YscQ/HrcQ family protein